MYLNFDIQYSLFTSPLLGLNRSLCSVQSHASSNSLCCCCCFQLTPVKSAVMHSLAQEIQGFSKNRLKKQCTRVTTVTGRKLLERRGDGGEGEEQVEELEEGGGCGFVEDKSLDLQVGVIRSFLLLGNILHEYFYIVCHII